MQPKPKSGQKHKPTKPGHGSDDKLKERNEMIQEVEKAAGGGKVRDYDGDEDVDQEQEYHKGGKVKGKKKMAKGGRC